MNPIHRAALALPLLACAVGPSAAAPLPAPIQKVTDAAFAECRDVGGAPSLLADYARPADLNGDGVDDYLVDFIGLNCAGAEAYFCGTAGCPVSVWLSTPSGYQHAWSGPARESRFDTSRQPAGVIVRLHGSFCQPPTDSPDGCELGLDLAAASASAPKPAADRPSPRRAAGWSLRAVPGASPVAVTAAPAPLRDIALFCLSGQPFLALRPESPPPGDSLRVGFGFENQTIAITARQEASAGGAYVVDLEGRPLAQALAGKDATVELTLEGANLGTLSLAGSSKAIRAALASCLKL